MLARPWRSSRRSRAAGYRSPSAISSSIICREAVTAAPQGDANQPAGHRSLVRRGPVRDRAAPVRRGGGGFPACRGSRAGCPADSRARSPSATSRPGGTTDAIPPLERIVSKAPNDVVAATKLAYCYMANRQGRAGGRGLPARPQGPSPSTASPGTCSGSVYPPGGREPREAVDAFQHAVTLAPGDLNMRTHLDESRQAAGGSGHA